MTRANKNPAPPASGHGANTSEAQDTSAESLSQLVNKVGQKKGRYAALSRAAIFDQRLSPAAVRVLAALASYADASGYCYPAIGTVAARLGMSRRTVERVLPDLEATGYLIKYRQKRLPGKGGGWSVNGYLLLFPAPPESELEASGGGDSGNEAEAASCQKNAIGGDATPVTYRSDTPCHTPSNGLPERNVQRHVMLDECQKHEPIGQNQGDAGLNPTLNPPVMPRTTAEGTAEAGTDATFEADRCDTHVASDTTPMSHKLLHITTLKESTLKPRALEDDQDDCLIPDRPAPLPQAKAASKEELNDARPPTADDPHQIVYRRLHKLTGQTGMAWGFLIDTPVEVHSSLVEYSNKRLVDAFSAWMRSPAAQAFDQGMEQCRLEAVNG